MRPIFALSALLAIAIGVAACTSAGDSGGPPCVVPPQLGLPQLLYPIPGSAGVPDNADVVILAGIGPAGGTVAIAPPSGPTIATNPEPLPSPYPSPAATPQSGASPSAFGVPTLVTKTTYNVVFTANAASTCTQAQSSGAVGSFTTQ